MSKHVGLAILLLAVLTGASCKDAPAKGGKGDGPVAVEVAPITSGRVRAVRVFAGTLEASSRFRAVAKVGGLVQSVEVDLGDTIERDQVVARIDDAELVQAAAQANANRAVMLADLNGAKSNLNLAQIEFDRTKSLHERGLVTQARLDEASAALASAKAALQLVEGRVNSAGAAVELARIQLGYTEVRASWTGGEETATVAARHQDPGSTVQAGDPIVDIVVLDPLKCVMTVPERDYPHLSVGQKATLTTDAAPGKSFPAEIARIAPVFQESSRQATVELTVDNAERLLKPGAFTRVELVLGDAEAGSIVPAAAVTRRKDQEVLFVVSESGDKVDIRPVTTGIREGDLVQVTAVDGAPLTGRVVVLGQQLLGEDSTIRVVDSTEASEGPERAEPGG